MDEPKTTEPDNSDPSEPMPGKRHKRGATERPRHCDAFQLYLKLRTIRSVAQSLNKPEKLVQTWSAKFQWRDRAKADDLRKGQIRAEEADRQDRQEVAFWTKQRSEHRQRKLKSGGAMMDRGERKLKHPEIERIIPAENGSTVFRPRSDTDARRLIIDGAKLIDETIAEALAETTTVQEIEVFELERLGTNDDDSQT
jgi:hypothetical protein